MNPTLDAEMIAAEAAEDAEAASSEWFGRFRASTTQYLDDELLDRAVVSGRVELPSFPGKTYRAWCDPSGGRHDGMTLGIAHQEPLGKAVLDRLLIERPPFDPAAVTSKFCEVLRGFGLTRVMGDRYAGQWVSSTFKSWGVTYQEALVTKSELYAEMLPLFAQDRIELLDVQALITEFRLLERRPRSGGHADLIDHPPRASDDMANSAAGALWLASTIPEGAITRDRRARAQQYAEM